MILVLSRKSAVFLILGVFALLFGMIQGASAATCLSYGDGVPTNPEWQGAGTITGCTIQYDDPTGGSNLSICKYRVLSNSTQTVPAPPPDPEWVDASGTCSGNSATLSINISIGPSLNCRDNGENKCRVEFKAGDNAGNSATGTIVTLDIDYEAPTTNFDAPSGYGWSNDNLAFDLECTGETGESGCKASPASDYKIVSSSTTCTTSGLTAGTAGTVSCASGSACEQKVCYRSTDIAGNVQSIQTSNVFQTDKDLPDITSFAVTSALPITIANPTLNIDWSATETSPNSGLKEAILYRKLSSQGPDGWAPDPGVPSQTASGSSDSDTFSYAFPLGVEETYDYGIHVKDQVDNACHENLSPCGDAVSTITNVQVDTKAPTVTINQKIVAPAQADPTNVSPINFTAEFSESVTGFTGTDVSFAGSTAGGTLTASVTPASGTTYNVAVSGMTTGGTVRATILADGAIDQAGNLNTASISTDNTVTYDVCIPPGSGDWEIATNCIVQNQNYTINGNIIIQSTGTLDMRGTTNITFGASAARYIYVYPGGQLFQAGTAGFNKP